MLVATRLVRNGGVYALYRGLSAVMADIVPKMAVRFSSFDTCMSWLGVHDRKSKGIGVRLLLVCFILSASSTNLCNNRYIVCDVFGV